MQTTQHDEHSYAQPDKVRITDLALDLAIDFEHKQLSGTATYALDWLRWKPQMDREVASLVLDTRDLTIEKIVGDHGDGTWDNLSYDMAPADKILGSKLSVQMPARNTKVRITYRTSPSASGLQWLEPSMTQGKQQPFMFSQSEAIHARSWVPLQDTPGVRFTYSAHVTADGLKFAQDAFAKARAGYHSITTASVEQTIAKAQTPAKAAP